MKYLAITEGNFLTDSEVTNVDNYPNPGLFLVYYNVENERRKALVLVCKNGLGNSSLTVVLDDAQINAAKLHLLFVENEQQNIASASNEALENKVEHLEKDNTDLMRENKSLKQQMNILNMMVEPVNNSTLEETSGTVSESFVLELTKILTQKN